MTFSSKITLSLLTTVMMTSSVVAMEVNPYPVIDRVQDDVNAVSKDDDNDSAEDKKDKKKDLPLKPERKIEFETNEGTWLSLDISPDGQTIMFELLGDIYTMPVTGGDANAIVTGMAFQSQPVFSPDGTKIAFLSDQEGSENLYVADVDGTNPKKLSKIYDGVFLSPDWSPDSEYIYVTQTKPGTGGFEAWMYHKNGGSGVQITKFNTSPSTPRNKGLNVMGISASADGKYLYYANQIGGWGYNLKSFGYKVTRYDLSEGTSHPIVTALGGAFRPVVSPDGKTLVYGTRYESETGLRLRNLETGEDRWLAYPVTHDDLESYGSRGLLPSYSFLPDGSAIVMNLDGKIKSITISDGAITDIPFKASVNLDIGPNLIHQTPDDTGDVIVRMAQGPALSPGGKVVVFSALGELYSMNLAADAKPTKIDRAGEKALMPSWSHDGRWLTYITWEYDGGHIWRMRTDGKSLPERVTKIAGYYSEPTYTQDGSEIVAIRASNYQFNIGNPDAHSDLVAFPSKGGAARVVLPGVDFGTIHFGDVKDRINLTSNGTVFSVRLDGTDRRDHVTVKGKGSNKPVAAKDVRLSPNGRWALAKTNQQLHLVAVPQIGKKAQTVKVTGGSVPAKQISDIGADYFDWSNDGTTMMWSVGSTIFTQDVASVEWEKSEKEDKEEDKNTETGCEKEEAEADKEELKKYTSYYAKVTVPRDNPEGIIVMRGATAITMGPSGTIENADILVKDGKFVAVGASGSLEVPKGAEIRDMSGKFITPGFVDTHGHWRNWDRREVKGSDHWPFLANVAYGVTSGLDVQTGTTDIFVAQDMVDSGRMIGMRAWSTGPGVFSDNHFKDKKHAVNVLTRYKEHYRTKNIKAYLSGSRKQRQYVIQASKELGIMPTTEGGLDLKMDITHLIDGFSGNEHNYPIFPVYKDIIELTAKTGMSYTPTLLVTYGGPSAENHFFTTESPHDDKKLNTFIPHGVIDKKTKRRNWVRQEEYSFSRIAESAVAIQRAGGYVGVGSHGQLQGLGYHWEMRAIGSGGATNMEILKAATINGAHIIGHETEVGSIEAGKFADLVIMNSDPREDLKNAVDIHRVMMNGRLYDDDTMDELWPRQKKLGKLWFHDKGPKVE